MSHGKRWRVEFDVQADRNSTGDPMWDGTVTPDTLSFDGSATNVLAFAVVDFMRAWPTATISDARLTMECRTCGYEAPDGGPYQCKCDRGDHAC